MAETETPKVYAAIVAVAAKLCGEGVAKTGYNRKQDYYFRTIDDMYNALGPALVKCKLCMLPRTLRQETEERKTPKGGVAFRTIIDMEFDFVSEVDASSHTVRTYGENIDYNDKSHNKAMVAAYKYAAIFSFSVPIEGEDDGDGSSPEVIPKSQPKPTPPTPLPQPKLTPTETKAVMANWKDLHPELKGDASNAALKSYLKEKYNLPDDASLSPKKPGGITSKLAKQIVSDLKRQIADPHRDIESDTPPVGAEHNDGSPAPDAVNPLDIEILQLIRDRHNALFLAEAKAKGLELANWRDGDSLFKEELISEIKEKTKENE